jgi:hypothetical protein
MCALWENFMDSGNRLHLQIQLFLQLNVKVIKLLDEFSPKFGFYALPEAPAKQVFAMGCSMAQVHLQISEQCDESAIRAFNITAKTHFSLHSLQLCGYIHPYVVWCFKGESQMRVCARIWKSCLSGAKHWAVSTRAASKFRHRLHMHFDKILKDAA